MKAGNATVCLVKVQTPAAETYRIHRRWLPWRRRTRAEALDWLPDFPGGDLDFDDDLGLVIVALLLLPFLVILAFVLGEVLLLLLLFPFFVLARAVFGTPWIIQVTLKRKVVHVEAVEGWAESSKRIHRLATALRQGDFALPQADSAVRQGHSMVRQGDSPLRQGDLTLGELWPAPPGTRRPSPRSVLADVPAAEHQRGQTDDEHDHDAQVGRAVTKGQ